MWRVVLVTEDGGEVILSREFETRREAEAELEEEMTGYPHYIEDSLVVGAASEWCQRAPGSVLCFLVVP